jgi:hypothetical protein
MSKRVLPRLLLVLEAALVLVTIGLAVALPSGPEFLPCGRCPDPAPNGPDPHRFALRLVIVVVGTLVFASVDALRHHVAWTPVGLTAPDRSGSTSRTGAPEPQHRVQLDPIGGDTSLAVDLIPEPDALDPDVAP